MEYAVPQGSALSPLLFVIYIKDIIKVCSDKYIKMFADDTLIYVNGEGSEELEHKINMVFLIIEQWQNVNKLKKIAQKAVHDNEMFRKGVDR